MERILVTDTKKRKKIVAGYFDNGVFLRRGVDPLTDFNKRVKGYCLPQEVFDAINKRECQLVHYEIVRKSGDRQILESEFEDWIINAKKVTVGGESQRCLPEGLWRIPLQSDRIDNKPVKTKKQEKLEKNATIDMHSASETRFCRKCEEFTGREPILNCKAGRFWEGATKVPTKRKAKIYFLGESPWKDEIADVKGRFLVGRSGEELDDWIYDAGVNPKDVYVDNVVRCAFPRTMGGYDAGQRNKIRDNCSVYLFSELDRLKPEVIVPMGNLALQALLGVSNITKWIGRHVIHPRLKCHIVPVLHPAGVLRNPWFRDEAIETLEFAKTFVGHPPKFRPIYDKFVLDDKMFNQCMSEMEKAKSISVDLETVGLDVFADYAKIIGIVFSANTTRGYFVPLWDLTMNKGDEGSALGWNFSKPVWNKRQLARINKILGDSKKEKVFHNAGFDVNWLLWFGFNIKPPIYDTIISNSVLDSIDNGLKDLSWLHTSFGGYEGELGDIPKVGSLKRYDLIDPFVLAKYGAYDGVATQCVRRVHKKMEKTHNASGLLPDLMKLRYNLSKMELRGCKIDVKRAKELQKEYEAEQIRIEKNLRSLLKLKTLNVNSPDQLIDVLYGNSGVLSEFDVKPSTAVKVFTDIRRRIHRKAKPTMRNQKQLKVIDGILEYRKFGKLISTYLKPFIVKHDENKRIHTSFTVHVVRTGRLSSKSPNLQNIARKGGIRDCFIADPGCVLVEMDYSQLELRVAAECSQDKKMLAILNDPNGDIHSQVGVVAIKQPNGLEYSIDSFHKGELRAKAKITGFSIIYGKTPMSLAFDLDCDIREAARIQRFLLDGFPELGEYILMQQARITKYGYVDNLFGRRYYIDGAQSSNPADVEAAYRKSVNYPIQGTASDILVLALNRIEDRIQLEQWPVQMLLTVHDSLLFNVEKSFKKEFLYLVKEEMERPIPQIQHVRLFVDCKVGYRWGSAKEVVIKAA